MNKNIINALVFLPLMLGLSVVQAQTVVKIAKSGGDFSDPVAVVNAITDASANNRYVLSIAPGEYQLTQTLVLKPFVDIKGSGANVTKLTGSVSTPIGKGIISDYTSALVAGADNSTISSISIENKGGSYISIGLYNDRASPTLRSIEVIASGGILYSYGLYNSTSSPQMTQVSATAMGTSRNVGIINKTASAPIMESITSTATGGKVYNIGIRNHSSKPIMRDVTSTALGAWESRYNHALNNYNSPIEMQRITASATGLGAAANYGMNIIGGPITINEVIATASGSDNSVGVNVFGARPLNIENSRINGIRVNNGVVYINASTVSNSVEGFGAITCVGSKDGTGRALNAQCR